MDKRRLFHYIAIGTAISGMVFLFSPFLTMILLAGVFAFAMDPIIEKLCSYKMFQRRKIVILTLMGFFICFIVPIAATIHRLYFKLSDLALASDRTKSILQSLMSPDNRVFVAIQKALTSIGLQSEGGGASLIEQSLQRVLSGAVSVFSYIISQVPQITLSFFIFCICLYYFLSQAPKLKKSVFKLDFISQSETQLLINALKDYSYSAVVSSAITGSVQAVLVALGGYFFANADFMIVFVITFLFSFVPIIGTAPVALVLSIPSWFTNDYGSGLGLVGIAVLAGTIDNVLRPLLAGSSREVAPSVMLVVMIGGVTMMGLPGLLLSPVIAGIAFRLIPVFVMNLNNHRPELKVRPRTLPTSAVREKTS